MTFVLTATPHQDYLLPGKEEVARGQGARLRTSLWPGAKSFIVNEQHLDVGTVYIYFGTVINIFQDGSRTVVKKVKPEP